jgi:hypothetical protein
MRKSAKIAILLLLLGGFFGRLLNADEGLLQTIRNYRKAHEQQIMVNYGFAQPESKWESLMMAIQYPCLNLNGLTCGWNGAQQRTIIPLKATAGLDIRLDKGTDPKLMMGLIVDHIRQQGYHVVKQDPDVQTGMKYPLHHHNNGINLYLTFSVYSAYPGSSFFNVASSNAVRTINKIQIIPEKINPQYVPRASGVAEVKIIYPRYPGWRTYLYGPSVATVCCRSICSLTKVEKNLLETIDHVNIMDPRKMNTNPAIFMTIWISPVQLNL